MFPKKSLPKTPPKVDTYVQDEYVAMGPEPVEDTQYIYNDGEANSEPIYANQAPDRPEKDRHYWENQPVSMTDGYTNSIKQTGASSIQQEIYTDANELPSTNLLHANTNTSVSPSNFNLRSPANKEGSMVTELRKALENREHEHCTPRNDHTISTKKENQATTVDQEVYANTSNEVWLGMPQQVPISMKKENQATTVRPQSVHQEVYANTSNEVRLGMPQPAPTDIPVSPPNVVAPPKTLTSPDGALTQERRPSQKREMSTKKTGSNASQKKGKVEPITEEIHFLGGITTGKKQRTKPNSYVDSGRQIEDTDEGTYADVDTDLKKSVLNLDNGENVALPSVKKSSLKKGCIFSIILNVVLCIACVAIVIGLTHMKRETKVLITPIYLDPTSDFNFTKIDMLYLANTGNGTYIRSYGNGRDFESARKQCKLWHPKAELSSNEKSIHNAYTSRAGWCQLGNKPIWVKTTPTTTTTPTIPTPTTTTTTTIKPTILTMEPPNGISENVRETVCSAYDNKTVEIDCNQKLCFMCELQRDFLQY